MTGQSSHHSVAFVTTVYNGAESLEIAVNSGLSQTWPIDEYIIVDDGSCDSTWSVIEKVAASDSRVMAYKAGRVGRAAALNLALSMCSSEFIYIQDADDHSEPNRVAATMPLFSADPRVAVVAGAYRAVDLQSGASAVRRPSIDHEDILRAMCGRVPICHTASAYRKEAWRAVGGYPNATPQIVDMPFWLAIARGGWHFCGHSEVIATHHYYGSSNFKKLFSSRRRAWILYRYNLEAFTRLRPSVPDLARGTGRFLSAWALPDSLRGTIRIWLLQRLTLR